MSGAQARSAAATTTTRAGARGSSVARDDVALHPFVAELACAIARSDDGAALVLPKAAVAQVGARLRVVVNPEIAVSLVALAVRVRRTTGAAGAAVVAAIGELVACALGSRAAASERFAAAGLHRAAAALLGAPTTGTAPRADRSDAAFTLRRGLARA